MKKENIALIGYGYWGKKIYRYLKESDNFHLSYVFFPSLKDYDRVSINEKFGREFTPQAEKIWQDREVPHVAIATPINTHFAVASLALSHNKNVLVEKPLAENTQDANSLAKSARGEKLILETEYTYTYSPALNAAVKMIEKGIIGKIQSISISFKQLGRFLPYSVYVLLGSHALSILDLFIPLREWTFSTLPLMTTNSVVTGALIQFRCEKIDCRGYIELSLHYPKRDKKVVIYGEKGTLVYTPDEKEALTLNLYKRRSSLLPEALVEKSECFSFDESHNLKNALDNFYALIQNKRESNINRSLAVNAVLESFK